ncbi:hypothetical protein SCFA_430005 [anaerobic digester metagenome]|uniref:Uncharacterized protein n=1 Tax=anaerobic digester metagenome TaxID=1263854 RepID=A0A485M0W0_9ZZZZ
MYKPERAGLIRNHTRPGREVPDLPAGEKAIRESIPSTFKDICAHGYALYHLHCR